MTDAEVRSLLKGFFKIPDQVFPAEVLSVDLNTHTIKVKPVGRAEIPDVRLKAGEESENTGIVEVPEVNSSVLVGLIGNDKNTAYVVKCSKVSSVIINGGDLGGLIKIEELKSELDKYNQLLEAFLNALSTPVSEPGNGAPSAFQAALNSALSSKQLPDFAQIEDDKVKH